ISRRIARPIEKLKIGAEEIQKGNFEYRTDVKSSDEVGQLAAAFNKMVSAVVASRSEIDQKVSEQTKEIIEKQNDIKSFLGKVSERGYRRNKSGAADENKHPGRF
ncbi:MAG: HAMP domain-containing protein, partial [Lentisphaerota bacterium]